MLRRCNSITYPSLGSIFDRSGYIAYLACTKLVARLHCNRIFSADLHNIKLSACRHHFYIHTGFNNAVDNSEINDYALIRVIIRIKNKRFKRFFVISLRRRNFLNNGFKHLLDINSRFCRNSRCVLSLNSDNIFNIVSALIGIGARQIYFIDNRHNFKVVVKRQISIGKSLSLYSL